MKLCIVSTNDFFSNYGGGEIFVRNVVDEFIKQRACLGIDFFVLTFSNKNESIDYKGVSVYTINNKNDVYRILAIRKPDIVHAHGMFDWVLPVCKKNKIPSVVTIHDSMYLCPNYTYLDYNNRFCSLPMTVSNCLHCSLAKIKAGRLSFPILKHIPINRLISLGKWLNNKPFIYYITPIGQAAFKIKEKIDYWKETICMADKIVMLSNRMVLQAVTNDTPIQKIILLPNGIPHPQYKTPFPSINGTIRFFYTGRLCFSKGIHVLLSAFHSLSENNCELHIIGWTNNDEESKYISILKKKYLNDKRIYWHPRVNNNQLFDYTKDFHVMVHPSIGNETFSLSIAEALSFGKYVIATKCGGPQDQIIEGFNGNLVITDNELELSNALNNYLKHPHPPKDIIFTPIEDHINKLYKLYSSMVETKQIL